MNITLEEINTWFYHNNNGLTSALEGFNYTNGTICPIVNIELLMLDNTTQLVESNMSSDAGYFYMSDAYNFSESLKGIYENPVQINVNIFEVFAPITNFLRMTTHGGVQATKEIVIGICGYNAPSVLDPTTYKEGLIIIPEEFEIWEEEVF